MIQRRLPRGADPVPEPPALGYRGFCYLLDGVQCRTFHGTVTGRGWVLADAGRELEHLLLDTFPAEYADLRARVARAVDRDR